MKKVIIPTLIALVCVAAAVLIFVKPFSAKTPNDKDVIPESATDQKEADTTVFGDETVLYFGEDKAITDASIGNAGALTDKKHDEDLDWDLEYYSYQGLWFDMDKALPTRLEYRVLNEKRFLNGVEIAFSEAGYTMEQMKEILTQKYGEPDYTEDNYQYADYKDYIWSDDLRSMGFSLTYNGTAWTIQASGTYSGGGTVIQTYDLTGGIEQYKNADPLHYKLLVFMRDIAGEQLSYLDTLVVWTDGLSYQLGAAYPTQEGDNSRFTMRLDINDIYDRDGNYRHFDKSLFTFVHEFGHVLTLNNTQVDLLKQPKETFYYVADSFMDGSYLKAFYDAFWKSENVETGEQLYKAHPDMFVDEYAATNTNEDIAESFATFVLGDKPTGTSIADQKVSFFYGYPELVTLRSDIRANFGYDK